MTQDERYMQRAVELALKGRGYTHPNPMVGAVIVKNDKVIGEGYHHRYGEAHAERDALANCTEDPAGATVYVTLEPCCHQGKQPPCTEALIEKKIVRVVVGSDDPNPLVAGKGIKTLRDAGIEVVTGCLKESCDAINPVFFHYIREKMPYVSLKYAMTADGKIATRTGESQWITGEEARAHVHRLRGDVMAVMAGIGTVLADDPMLNCRWEGDGMAPIQPARAICDTWLRIPLESKLCQSAKDSRVIVAYTGGDPDKVAELEKLGVTCLQVHKKGEGIDLREMLEKLGAMGIDSILVEGGGTLHASLLAEHLAQHLYTYVGAKIFGGADALSPVEGRGVATVEESVRLTSPQVTAFGSDLLLEYDLTYPETEEA